MEENIGYVYRRSNYATKKFQKNDPVLTDSQIEDMNLYNKVVEEKLKKIPSKIRKTLEENKARSR